jgi:hypothetical protein
MRSLAPLLVCGLLLTTAAAPLRASSLPAKVRAFQVLHAVEASQVGAEGLEVHLVEGQLEVKATRLQADGLTLEGVSMKAPIVVDDAFFAAPVTGMVTSLLEQGDMTVTRLSHSQSNLYTLHDMAVRFRQGKMSMVARKVVGVKAKGNASWDPETRKLTIEVESIKAGIVPVSRTVVFAAMKRILTFPSVELDKPFVRMDLTSFLR